MEDTYTETQTESYGSRMKNACTGVCIGFLLFFGSIGLLIWNEGRTVKRAKDIDEGQEVVVELDLSNVGSLSQYENKLVHVTASLSTPDTLMDPIFGVGTANSSSQHNGNSKNNASATTPSSNADKKSALKLSRNVEMFQWKESSRSRQVRTANGGKRTETTYSYSKVWSSSLINSDAFKKQNTSRQNPASFPFQTLLLEADPILLNDTIVLSSAVTSLIDWYESYDDISLDDVVDESLHEDLTVAGNAFYYSTQNGSNVAPRIGDTRVTFDYVPPDDISIVALFNKGDTMGAYETSRGGTLLLVERGRFSASELFRQADSDNTTLAWILRAVGFVLMVVSILLILQPLSTAVDIIPWVGDFLADGMEGCLFPLIAFIIAIPVSLFVIMLAWIFYRPVIAVPIAVVCLILMVLMYVRYRRKKEKLDNEEAPAEHAVVEGKVDNPYATDSVPVAMQTGPAAQVPVTTGGFASALDNPPPETNPPPTAPQAEPEVVLGEPYVPQVYKP